MTIPDRGIEVLKKIATEYVTRTELPSVGAWRNLDADAIWKLFVYQVAVVGASSSYERLKKSSRAQTMLSFEHLRSLDPEALRRTINEILREHSVRYASVDVAKCRKTAAVLRNFEFLSSFPGGPSAYLAYVASFPDDDARVARVEHDMSYIKLKGARDLLAELGMVTQIIAFDSRVLNVLRMLGAEVPADIQTDSLKYTQLQNELLTKVCAPIGLTGVQLDRILYQHYDTIYSYIRDSK